MGRQQMELQHFMELQSDCNPHAVSKALKERLSRLALDHVSTRECKPHNTAACGRAARKTSSFALLIPHGWGKHCKDLIPCRKLRLLCRHEN